MNTPLRSEIAYGLAETFALDMSNPKGIEYAAAFQEADRALALIASKMPENKTYGTNYELKSRTTKKYIAEKIGEITGYNRAIIEVKSILKGGTE